MACGVPSAIYDEGKMGGLKDHVELRHALCSGCDHLTRREKLKMRSYVLGLLVLMPLERVWYS